MKEGKGIFDRIYSMISRKGFLLIVLPVTAILILITASIESRIAGPDGYGPFYLQVAFDRQTFESILASWGSAGIRFYLETIWISFLYGIFMPLPLISGAAYFSESARNMDPGSFSGSQVHALLLAPVYTVSLWIESGFHLYILLGRNFSDSLIFMSSCVSIIKYSLLLACLVWMLKKYTLFRKIMKERGRGPAA